MVDSSRVLEALKNLQEVAPSFDPFKGHLAGDPDTKSRFFSKTGGESLIKDLLGGFTTLLEKDDSQEGVIIETYSTNYMIGTEVSNAPKEGQSYTMKMVHGCLQPTGVGRLHEEYTNVFTFVYTLEENTIWCLASCYPGRATSLGDLTNLNEGDVLSYEELLNRGITRVC